VELGATWFHGTHGNPVYELATRLHGAAADKERSGSGDEQQKDTTANAAGDPR
jgi:hypothetical protein